MCKCWKIFFYYLFDRRLKGGGGEGSVAFEEGAEMGLVKETEAVGYLLHGK